mmetsp:Transcript_13925/g.59592  ORF Transcript_13925/g.59592 Transcript_13925/m.59592 type:complete len:202 (+) Transcript_13925:1648-2253(+)
MSTPRNSPSGNGFALNAPFATVTGSYRSTTATVFVAARSLTALLAGSSRSGDSPSSLSLSSSSSSSSWKRSVSRSLTGSAFFSGAFLSFKAFVEMDDGSIHEPSGARPTVTGAGGERRVCDDFSLISSFSNSSPNTSTNTKSSPKSCHSPMAFRAPSARDSSVCRATVFSNRRSSFNRPSNFVNRAHSSGSTSDAPFAICS